MRGASPVAVIVKVALAPANTDWELKLELGLTTGGEAMAAQCSRMEARKSGIEFVFIVLGIFHFHAVFVFGLQLDGAFQGRAQCVYLLQDLFPAKGRNFLRETRRSLWLNFPLIPYLGTPGTEGFCAAAP